MKSGEAIDTYQNGNIGDFKKWLKRASKLDVLNAVEYYSGQYGNRHIIINMMRYYLRGEK